MATDTSADAGKAAADAANTPATSPNPPVQPNAPLTTGERMKAWGKKWGIPIAAGGTLAFVFGAPILIGGGIGAGARYVWEKWKAAK